MLVMRCSENGLGFTNVIMMVTYLIGYVFGHVEIGQAMLDIVSRKPLNGCTCQPSQLLQRKSEEKRSDSG
jgi:hypothetical protein